MIGLSQNQIDFGPHETLKKDLESTSKKWKKWTFKLNQIAKNLISKSVIFHAFCRPH